MRLRWTLAILGCCPAVLTHFYVTLVVVQTLLLITVCLAPCLAFIYGITLTITTEWLIAPPFICTLQIRVTLHTLPASAILPVIPAVLSHLDIALTIIVAVRLCAVRTPRLTLLLPVTYLVPTEWQDTAISILAVVN